jgi:hypothetical protein
MYSPKIKEEYIPVLYRIAQKLKKPMTAIVNDMIAESLRKQENEVQDNVTKDS